MAPHEIDDVDRALLNLLQQDARQTALELAESLDVSDNTVHNRMARLEEAGVITGYNANTDPEQVGLRLEYLFTCTASISNRSAVAQEAVEIPEVQEVTGLMTGEENVHIRAIGADDDDITRVAERIDELDLSINDEHLIREIHEDSLDFVEISGMLDREE